MAYQIPPRNVLSDDANHGILIEQTPKGSHDYISAGLPISDKEQYTPYNENTLPARYLHPRPSIRRYSGRWFSWKWDRAVKRGKWPRIFYAAFGLFIVTAWMGITIGFATDESRYQKANLALAQGASALPNRTNNDGFVLQGALKSFDPTARELVVNWVGQWEDLQGNYHDFGTDDNTTYYIGVWRDQMLVQDLRPGVANVSTDLFPLPIYTVDNVTLPPNGVLGLHPWDSFDTTIDLGQAVRENPWRQPLFGFPFDRWTGQISLVANFMNVAVYTGLNNSFGLPVHDIYFVDSIINWRITPHTENTCEVNGDYWPRYDTVESCQLMVTLTARRPGLVIFATLAAVTVNWFSTVFIFIMTCEGVVMRRASVIEGPQLLAVCFTALFALPSVRSILPGAPDFGALIDLIGIVPNVIIISLCTTAVAIESLRDMHRKAAASVE